MKTNKDHEMQQIRENISFLERQLTTIRGMDITNIRLQKHPVKSTPYAMFYVNQWSKMPGFTAHLIHSVKERILAELVKELNEQKNLFNNYENLNKK